MPGNGGEKDAPGVTIQPEKRLTFDDVWAMFQESRVEYNRMLAETNKAIDQTKKGLHELTGRLTMSVALTGLSVNRQIP